MAEMLLDSVEPLQRVADFVDDDLLSCFLWAAGENAVAQPGWESPSVNPLKGIPLPPEMPLLPPAGDAASSADPPDLPLVGAPKSDDGDDDDLNGVPELDDIGDDDIAGIGNSMGGPLSKEQKLTQRMQRKAESARVARLRKKEYVSGLEAEVAKLKAELVEARKGGASGGAAAVEPPTLREVGQRQLHQMDELLKRPSSENVVPEVNTTVEKYVANKRAQQGTINEYLDCIEDILSPGAPMQVAFSPGGLDALEASSSCSSAMLANTPSGSAGPLASALSAKLPPLAAVATGAAAAAPTPTPAPSGVKREMPESNGVMKSEEGAPAAKRSRSDSMGKQLLGTLSVELGLSKEQVDQLSKQNQVISGSREMNAKCLQLVKELRLRIAEHVGASQGITDCLRRILTPVQVAKFLMWVEKNQRSMDLLNTMLQSDG